MKTSLFVLSALLGAQAKRMHNEKFLQTLDHDNDTDDVVADGSLIQTKDHDLDTEDMPEGMDPTNLHLRDQDGGWVEYMEQAGKSAKKSQSNEKWDQLFQEEEDNASYEYVQMRDHDLDTDDMPEGQDPILLQTEQFTGRPIAEVMMQFHHQFDTEDIPDGQDPVMIQMKEDIMKFGGHSIGELVKMTDTEDDNDVLMQTGVEYTVTPHEKDNDDIVVELAPEDEDKHHSKHWNMMVEQKAKEMEHQMQIEENEEIAKEKAKEQAKLNAVRIQQHRAEMAREAAEAKRQAQIHKNDKPVEPKKEPKGPTVNFSELYDGIVPME